MVRHVLWRRWLGSEWVVRILDAAAGLGVNVTSARGWSDHSEVEPTNRNKLGLKSVHRGVRTCDG